MPFLRNPTYERDSAREKGHHSLEQNENRHGIQTLSKGFSFSLLPLHIKLEPLCGTYRGPVGHGIA